jgi:hypothetical protein
MMAKPSLVAQSAHYQDVVLASSHIACTCKSSSWQPSLIGATRQIRPLPGQVCPVHGPGGLSKYQAGWGIYSKLLSTGLRLAFNCSYGAGGLSISTTFLPINIVELDKSPAFTCIRDATLQIQGLEYGSMSSTFRTHSSVVY